jgi:hypothetical protein
VDSSETPHALPSVVAGAFTISITSYSGFAEAPEVVAAADGSEPQTGPLRPDLRLVD